ncbi:MAG TPA: molybdopterin-dependent oxidoreductase [Dehalococcoidia bacterium]|jgi:DMSO/TMAO reductase YedYZ molybdopterin-dependent catalytic subunit|nr:molybdopterin-dependent oxidoreductase [Dehalococcoidia bacterium]
MRISTLRSFWNGAAAGCAFVIVALIARAVETVPTLPELVQDRLVLAMPGPLFSLMLDRFLYLGKPLLFASLMLGQVLLGALAGVVIGRWGRPVLVAAALWLLTGFLVLPLANRGDFAGSTSVAVVTLLGYAAYAVTFVLLCGGARSRAAWFGSPRRANETGTPVLSRAIIQRRELLAGGALALVTVVLARRAIGRLPSLPPRGSTSASGDTSVSGGAAEETGALSTASGQTPGLPPAVTPPARFYDVSKNLLDPTLDGGKWSVRIEGMVAQPQTLTLADLEAMAPVTEYRTLECVSNEIGGDLISNGQWTGVHLADLLQRVGVQAGATEVRFVCADNYTANITLQQALDPTTLLAYKLDGAPLPDKHGYPARVLGVNTYGMKNPKWVTHIQLVSNAPPGFWQQQGWDEQGIVQTMSEIITPNDGAKVAPGATTVSGIAFAGGRGINRVEVSTDGGASWSEARLLPALGPYTWVFWQFTWQAQPGKYTLAVRATDGTGAVQPARRTDPFPAGATGYHEVQVRVNG